MMMDVVDDDFIRRGLILCLACVFFPFVSARSSQGGRSASLCVVRRGSFSLLFFFALLCVQSLSLFYFNLLFLKVDYSRRVCWIYLLHFRVRAQQQKQQQQIN